MKRRLVACSLAVAMIVASSFSVSAEEINVEADIVSEEINPEAELVNEEVGADAYVLNNDVEIIEEDIVVLEEANDNTNFLKAIEVKENQDFKPEVDTGAKRYYKFVVPKDGAYRISTVSLGKGYITSVIVHDKDMAAIKGAAGRFSNNRSERQYTPYVICTKGEVLYIVLESLYFEMWGHSIDNMVFRVESDPDNRTWALRTNESKETADNMSVGETVWGFINGDGNGNSDDWWKIVIDKKATYLFEAGEGAYKSIMLLDANNTKIFDNNLNENYSKTVELDPGTYYLHVSRQVGGGGLYKVKLSPKTENVVEKFKDVDAGQWYVNAIQYAYDEKFMAGFSDTLFAPSNNCSRAMIAQILFSLEGKPEINAQTNFNDLTANWYKSAVAWAYANKIVSGKSNTSFAPNDNITRQEMAVLLYKYTGYKGYDVDKTTSLDKYSDASAIANWAFSAMKWANANGIINGKSTKILDPNGTANRAEVAQMVKSFHEKIGK